MATKTTNLELVKPGYTEKADIGVINGNMDVIDAAIAANTAGKIDKPVGLPSGKFLQTGNNNTLMWGPAASPAQIASDVEAWLDDHMTGDETIALDNTLTVSGAAADAKVTGQMIAEAAAYATNVAGYMDFSIDENGH